MPNFDIGTLASAGDGELTVDYDILRREAGFFLSMDRDFTTWDTTEESFIDHVIKKGLWRFYWPRAQDGSLRHSWSFLRFTAELALVAGTRSYTLPARFAGLISDGFNYATGTNLRRIQRINEDEMRALYATSDMSGDPRYCAIRALEAGENVARYDVLFYPVPIAARTLNYRGAIAPEMIDEANPYPLGGPMHAQTILEAVLSAAEETLEDHAGLHAALFEKCLATSIQIDGEMAL